MRRELPSEPHIDHLKKQAKDLLHAHQRGEPEALARIREAVPSFAGMSDAEIARAPFALHDAQSAIAREYGSPSWQHLRARVGQRQAGRFPELLVRTLASTYAMGAVPEAVIATLRELWTQERVGAPADAPSTLPLVAVRNAMVVPGALVPLHIGRASSFSAIEAALAASPPLLAVFSQRDAAVEEVRFESLHPVGCLAILHRRIPDGEGRAWVIVQGLRWIALDALEDAGRAHRSARIAAVTLDDGDDSAEVSELVASLRDRARRLAAGVPQPDRATALVDAIDDAEQLADLVVANLPCPVEDKARYAAERKLAEKLRLVLTLSDRVLGAGP